MKIEYDTTIDEMITTQMLWLRDTKTFEKWMAWGVFYWLGIVFLVVYFGNGPLFNKLLVGFLFGGVIGGRMVFNPKSMIRKRLRKVLVKKLGSDNTVPASLLLTEDRLEYSTNNSSIAMLLKDLAKVEEIEDGLFLDFTKGNINYIPFCAFENDAEKEKRIGALSEICSKNT